MSFLGFFFIWVARGCLRVRSARVSGLDDTRARVCDAFFLSLSVRTESRSSTIMQLLSSITRTVSPGCMDSNEICLYASAMW